MSEVIKFGTDGWRDVIADRFTYENVARAAQAHAQYLKRNGGTSVVVGYDTRFGSDRFARVAAEVMAANGLRTLLTKTYTPTPALSQAVVDHAAAGGVMITASHNPPQYNGYKIKGAYGGSATPDTVKGVEAELARLEPVAAFDASRHSVESFDARPAYFEALARVLDLDALRGTASVLYHDAMGGAGAGWLEAFFKRAKLPGEVRPVHGVANPTFFGVNPEPIPANLESITAVMTAEHPPLFGAVTDGDADRIGAVLAGGEYFNSHQIFAVLLDHLYRKGLRGRVVKTFSTSQVIDRLAAMRGLEVTETPVGFKYITDAFLEGQRDPAQRVLIGGEESGGIAVQGHIPERDGLLNALLLLEAVVTSGKSLAELFAGIEAETGLTHAYDRVDLHLDASTDKAALLKRAAARDRVANRAVTTVRRVDGVKLHLDGDAWVLFRPSGTEPLVRVYSEAPTMDAVRDILADATGLLTGHAG